MKALKTIVATAVIVFALTTVAMAGARHAGGSDDAATQATSPAATETHQRAGVTLTDAQFARLLHAVNGQPAKLRTTQADRDKSRDRARARDHSRQKANDSAIHVKAQQRTQTHDGGGTHDHGTQSSSTHRSGTHDGGAVKRGGGTHDGGTYDGGTHESGGTHDAGGTHDGSTHHE
jgi:hypothetical protein